MKIKYLLVILVCMLIFPFQAFAACSYEREAELSKIASNVQFNYIYEVKNNEPGFNVVITNLTNDIYIQDTLGYNKTFTNQKEASFKYGSGSSVSFNIYSNDSNCYGEKIMTNYISLPVFNYYYNTAECKEYPDFKYCGIWQNTSVESEQFDVEFEKYKKNLNKDSKPITSNSTLSDFFKQNYQKIGIAVIVVVLAILGITIIRKIRKQ